MFRDIIQGLKNFKDYAKVIWRDRDWDEGFIFRLLEVKLIRMERHFRDHGVTMCSERCADEIKHARLVLQRIIRRDYDGNALLPFGDKYGDPYEFIIQRGVGRSVEPKSEEYKQAEKLLLRLYEHGDKQEQQDRDYLFKYLHRHIRKWWQ